VHANLEVDIIQLEWDPFRLNILPHSLELSHIRFLGLGDLDLQDQDSKHIVQQLKRFTSIEEITSSHRHRQPIQSPSIVAIPECEAVEVRMVPAGRGTRIRAQVLKELQAVS
jgi:hypothetical protein